MIVDTGKVLVFLGLGMAFVGGLLWLSGGALRSFPIGRLPGDILIQNENFSFYFPLTTGIAIAKYVRTRLRARSLMLQWV